MPHKGKPKTPPSKAHNNGNKKRYTAISPVIEDSGPGKKRERTNNTMNERKAPTSSPTAAATTANAAEIKMSRASLIPSI
jgi:hypothetical protein